ncbi:TPA: hypothetical protein DEO28_03225 [Candidatus Dependentiae bacterium]|nr:MAG: hypothetical protein UR14_C0005G0006 [candidate division TM6 bacterium GW2011_GWE2_31_21]KKP53082.1 MAG: hypothetical protein UR43_C0007G0006 [candidate division TM6 bacterium GW2011_GWF2_33_332]HBS47900.1 hypothetical protein [Candidatus Dependentiae bacterium]HBZ73496.1 hypothetical protein [Candidatus Dependentiae bacterium]
MNFKKFFSFLVLIFVSTNFILQSTPQTGPKNKKGGTTHQSRSLLNDDSNNTLFELDLDKQQKKPHLTLIERLKDELFKFKKTNSPRSRSQSPNYFGNSNNNTNAQPANTHPFLAGLDSTNSKQIIFIINSAKYEKEIVEILNEMAALFNSIKQNDEELWFVIVQANKFLRDIISACVELNEALPNDLRVNFHNLTINCDHIFRFDTRHQAGFHFLADKQDLVVMQDTIEEDTQSHVFCAHHHANKACPHGKFSTFFPQHMTHADVIESVRQSFYQLKIAFGESKYIAFNLKYQIYLEVFLKNENGIITITSAFPILYFIENGSNSPNHPFSKGQISTAIREAKNNIDFFTRYKTDRETTILDLASILKNKNLTKAESGIYVEVSNNLLQ